MRKIATVLTVLAIGACGEVRWAKSDLDAATLDQDLKTCRTVAAERAARMGALLPPSSGYDPRFGAPPGPTQMDQRMQERQIEERCMRDKGYALVPAEK